MVGSQQVEDFAQVDVPLCHKFLSRHTHGLTVRAAGFPWSSSELICGVEAVPALLSLL